MTYVYQNLSTIISIIAVLLLVLALYCYLVETKKSRRVGRRIVIIAGVTMILLGIFGHNAVWKTILGIVLLIDPYKIVISIGLMIVAKNPEKYFIKKADLCSYEGKLQGELLAWGASIPMTGKIWDYIEAQLRYLARTQGKTMKQTIDWLFNARSADNFMLRFQVAQESKRFHSRPISCAGSKR